MCPVFYVGAAFVGAFLFVYHGLVIAGRVRARFA